MTERRRPARRGQGERLRDEIVEAASQMLAKSGDLSELSLRAVARAVGIATTSIYLHFQNIDELVLAVKIRYFADFGAALHSAAEAAGSDPLARARARAHAYVEFGLTEPGRYFVMFTSETLPAHMLPGVLYLGVEVFEEVRAEVAAVLRPEEDANLRAIHFWTALHGIVTLRSLRPNFPWPDLEAQIDDLIAQLLHP